jgi:hypothetical protein
MERLSLIYLIPSRTNSLPTSFRPFNTMSQEQLANPNNFVRTTHNTRRFSLYIILKQGIEHFRVLIIGNANAGKTTILEKVCHLPICNAVNCGLLFSWLDWLGFRIGHSPPFKFRQLSFVHPSSHSHPSQHRHVPLTLRKFTCSCFTVSDPLCTAPVYMLSTYIFLIFRSLQSLGEMKLC